jgi:predicted  nucleic acid-binding Zn-ribbon protein
MIELIKHLKKEKAVLEARINQREKEFDQLQDERGEVRLRIERILGTLNHLDGEPSVLTKGSAGEE